jgi:hypothetical protein
MSSIQLKIAIGVLVVELAIVAWRVFQGKWDVLTFVLIGAAVILGILIVVEWLKNR